MKFFLRYFPVVQISLSFPALSPFWKRRMLKSARRLLHQRFWCCGHWFSGARTEPQRWEKARDAQAISHQLCFRTFWSVPGEVRLRINQGFGVSLLPRDHLFPSPVRSEYFLWWELEDGSRHSYKWGPGAKGEDRWISDSNPQEVTCQVTWSAMTCVPRYWVLSLSMSSLRLEDQSKVSDLFSLFLITFIHVLI